MRVTIWDMDFYHKKSFLPNPKAMKISSFHKQQGDLINFVGDETEIFLSYDLYYVIRENETTPRAPGKLVNNPKVRLLGHPMRFFDNYWDIDEIIAAVRPDYLLYPEVETRAAYYNAHVVQFYHNGKKLPLIQPFENIEKHHRKTLVIDTEKDFWGASEKDLISTLTELLSYKNIAFKHGIPLKRIMENPEIRKLFISLDWSPGTVFNFRNNYGQSINHAAYVFEFISEAKKISKGVRFTNVPFMAVTLDHRVSRENAFFDMERCFQIMDLAKRKQIPIKIVSPRNRFKSPFWYYFETFEVLTTYFETLSYVEYMARSASIKAGLKWFEALNDSTKWSTPNINYLLKLMTKTNYIEKYGYRRWGENFANKALIDFSEINKFKGINNDDL